jgi:hypothetical protein
MDLTNWVIILALALISIAFFCTRAPANWSLENRARRVTGTRLLAQAVLAFWAALLVVVRGLFTLGGKAATHVSPSTVIVSALLLMVASGYWSFRGRRLLKPRRLFSAI